MWSIDLMEMSGYGISNFRVYRNIPVVIDKFSNYVWCIPLKNKYVQTINDDIMKNITTSEQKLKK